jgi:serine/threonine protein kinase
MENAIVCSIVSMAQLAWRTCADATTYKEECQRIGDRLTVVIVITKHWNSTTASSKSTRPSLSSLRNLQNVLRNLTLTLQKATTDRSAWTKRVKNFAFPASMLETLNKVEADLNSALQDFQTAQNNHIIQIVAHQSQRFQRVEEALLNMAEHRRTGRNHDSPSFLQVMDEVLHDHQLDDRQRSGNEGLSDSGDESSYLDDLTIDYLGIEPSPLEVDHSSLHYKLKDHLGSGSFGDVYRGTYKEEKVAVKLIRIDTYVENRRNSIMERLEKEAMVMARMGIHPNILHLYGFDLGRGAKNESRPMLVMELMDTTLYAALHSVKTLTHGALIGLMKGIASALEFLHLQGIVHRDIKSLNILLSRHCTIAKLSDFGEAKENGLRFTTAYHSNSAASPASMHGGTLAYHAPEILVGKLIGPSRKADIYAFGIVLWECLTRQIPFDGQHDFDVIRHALDESMPYLLDMPDAKSLLSDDAKRFLTLAQSCMHRVPKSRPNATQAVRHFHAKEVKVPGDDAIKIDVENNDDEVNMNEHPSMASFILMPASMVNPTSAAKLALKNPRRTPLHGSNKRWIQIGIIMAVVVILASIAVFVVWILLKKYPDDTTDAE